MRGLSVDKVLILDFGSQYTQLIARRVREINVYCEILPYDVEPKRIEQFNPKAIIFSEPMIQFFGKDALKKWWYHVHHNEYHPRKVWHMMVLGSWMK